MTLDDLTNIYAGDGPLDMDMNLPVRRDQQQFDMAPMGPFATRMPGSWDDRCMDRMLTIKRPQAVPSGTIWITEAGFAETLSLIPLNRVEQQKYWRKFRKIQMISTGELSKRIVDSRQERLMAELVSQKSRLDVAANGNLNEREMWVTNRQLIEQTLKTPPPMQSKGFFGTVADGLRGR